jgi:DeoR/GlpR family transcriptional regulator of sugar metabolism
MDTLRAPSTQRRARILELLRENGEVTVSELSAGLAISGMTARRDLEQLARTGQVRRTHGGAVLRPMVEFDDTSGPRRLQAAEPVAAAIAVGATVFLDSSPAGCSVAHALGAAPRSMTVLTNSLTVMHVLAPASTVRLVGLPGRLSRRTRTFVGLETDAMVRHHFADLAILGVDEDEPDALNAHVKVLALEHASEAIVIGDGRCPAGLAECLAPLPAPDATCPVRLVG